MNSTPAERVQKGCFNAVLISSQSWIQHLLKSLSTKMNLKAKVYLFHSHARNANSPY